MQLLLLALRVAGATALQVATNTGVNQTVAENLAGGNLCMKGRFAPRFFLIGAPKSGTTYFFEDFMRSKAIVSYTPLEPEPSWHAKEPWVFANGFTPSNRNKKRWLSHYPRCQQSKHSVAVDCTPGYFSSQEAPFLIRKMYRPSHHLVFMVFLREPVVRAQSHYYHFKENGVLQGHFKLCTPDQFPPTFMAAVTLRLTQKLVCNCSCDAIFEDSMYADAFRRYFKNFDSGMFHVVPFKHAITHLVVEYAWKILGVPPGRGEMPNIVGGGNVKNHHDYPVLAQEMHSSLLFLFQDFMGRMAGPQAVGRVLSNSSAHLYGFGSIQRSTPAVADWLEVNW